MATACETAHCMVPLVRRDGEVFGGAPEGGGGVVVVVAGGGVDVDVAGDVGGVGRGAEAGDFGVEADGDVEVIVAGEEEEGVALGTELVVLLDGVDAIDLGLHGGGGRGGREDGDVGAEVGCLSVGGGDERVRARRRGQRSKDRIAWATGYALEQAFVLWRAMGCAGATVIDACGWGGAGEEVEEDGGA